MQYLPTVEATAVGVRNSDPEGRGLGGGWGVCAHARRPDRARGLEADGAMHAVESDRIHERSFSVLTHAPLDLSSPPASTSMSFTHYIVYHQMMVFTHFPVWRLPLQDCVRGLLRLGRG
jgi:hypothetical protein